MQENLQHYKDQTLKTKNQQVHFDYEDQDQNLTPQQKSINLLQQKHMKKDISKNHKPSWKIQSCKKYTASLNNKVSNLLINLDTISKQLQTKLYKLLDQINFSNLNSQQKLKLRMHQLALSKILVNTHAKTDFYLVKAHHHLGQAYLNYKCYEQALDHLTIALKKNAKINEINQIKLYHSYLLTTYSRCYYEISSYDDALQILKKAHDIQIGCQTDNFQVDNLQTLKLISSCYLKLKNYPESLSFIEKALTLIQNKKGKQSKQYARGKIQKARILICQQTSRKQAIKTLQEAIETLLQIRYQNEIEVAEYYELLSEFYQKQKDYEKQIENLFKKYEIYIEKYEQGHEKTLKVKKNIALLLQKYNRIQQAINQFQQILEYEQKFYPENRTQIGKTLKALATCYLTLNINLNEAQQYLKKAQKLLAENGVGKSNRDIKSKLQQLKQKKQSKVSSKEEMKTIEKQINLQPIQTIH